MVNTFRDKRLILQFFICLVGVKMSILWNLTGCIPWRVRPSIGLKKMERMMLDLIGNDDF